MPRAKLKSTKTRQQEIDTKEFQTLHRLMCTVYGSRHTASKALQVGYKTFCRWETDPPTWPFYNMVMEYLVRTKLRTLIIKRTGFTQRQKNNIEEQLSQLSNYEDIWRDIEHHTLELHGCEDHLRQLLSRKGMYFDKIRKPHYCGGYSPRTLERTAVKMGILQETRGYGADKRTYWRLPTLENELIDLDDQEEDDD